MRRPDVALVLAPIWGVNRPPLGLASLSTFLRHQGLRVRVWDLNLRAFFAARDAGQDGLWNIGTARDADPLERYLRLEPLLGPLLDRAADDVLCCGAPVIGLFTCCTNRPFVQRLVDRLRQRCSPRLLVLGGPEVRDMVLDRRQGVMDVDYLVPGEGEETLLELSRRYLGGGPLGHVPGAVAGPHLTCRTELAPALQGFVPRPPPRRLDRRPWPTYEEFNLQRYQTDELPFLFSRGCTGRCVFCADRLLQEGFRCRSAEHAAAELLHHYHRHGARVFTFNDLICNGDPGQLRRLCRLVADLRLDLAWSSYAMISPDLDRPTLERMLRSGCFDLHLGLESGADRVLRQMHKPYTVDQAIRVLRDATEVGVRTGVNLIVGFLGETRDDFLCTLTFLRDNRPMIHKLLNLSTPTAFVGTALAARPRDDLVPADECRRRVDEVVQLAEEIQLPVEIINHGDAYQPSL